MKSTALAALVALVAAVYARSRVASSVLFPRQASESIQGGAIYTVPAGSSDTITSISGTFKVPSLSIPIQGPFANRAGGIYAFSVNIGIGGYKGFGSVSSCPASSGALRAGVDVYYNGFDDSPMAPFAWYQYGVADERGAFAYVGFNLEAGDLIRVTVTAESSSSVNVIMENFGKVDSTTGRQPLQREPPTFGLGNNNVASTLCSTEAAWFVEDHMTETEPSLPVIMGNFTDIVFGEISLKTKTAGEVAASAVKLVDIDIKDQGGQLTDCKASGNEVRCKRVVVGARATPRADGQVCDD